MELDSVLIGLGMLIVFMAPVYLLIQSGKRKKQKRIKAFKDFANGFGLKLNEVSSWSNTYLMATDKEGTTVFYANGNDSTQPYQRIELANKSRCEVVTEARTLKNGKETSRVIDR